MSRRRRRFVYVEVDGVGATRQAHSLSSPTWDLVRYRPRDATYLDVTCSSCRHRLVRLLCLGTPDHLEDLAFEALGDKERPWRVASDADGTPTTLTVGCRCWAPPAVLGLPAAAALLLAAVKEQRKLTRASAEKLVST